MSDVHMQQVNGVPSSSFTSFLPYPESTPANTPSTQPYYTPEVNHNPYTPPTPPNNYTPPTSMHTPPTSSPPSDYPVSPTPHSPVDPTTYETPAIPATGT